MATINGTAGNDTLAGGAAADLINAFGGNDTLSGGAGNDTIFGGAGDDTYRDDLVGGGSDQVSLEAGNDTAFLDYVASGVNQTVDGGTGLDTFNFSNFTLNAINATLSETGTINFGGTLSAQNVYLNFENLTGNEAANTLVGNNGANVIIGNGGADSLRGLSGDDQLFGGSGDDALVGDSGDDLLDGGTGNDSIAAGSGEDTVAGGSGNDSISGDQGNDSLSGDAGVDRIDGGTGADLLFGGDSGDTLTGGDQDDTIFGGTGSDSILGENGSDSIQGDAGADRIDGGASDDVIDGGADSDTIDGGVGNDVLAGGDDADTVRGGDGDDDILGGEGIDSLSGDAGNDTIDGGSGADRIYGGAGNDTLDAGDSEILFSTDNVFGGDGNDTLTGGGAGDDLFGGQGSDTFVAAPDNVLLGEIQVFGGEDAGNTDNDVLDLSAYRQAGFTVNVSLTSPDGEDGLAVIVNPFGQVLTSIQFNDIERVFICFTPGTMIATPGGEVPVEALRAGDRVLTRDNGFKDLAWVGRRDLAAADLAETPAFQPVLVRAGSLAPGVPDRDLVVSPQHRVLFTGPAAELHFGDHEVLVAARHLVGRAGIERLKVEALGYVHLLFDRHEVVLSNGAWTESFQPGDWSMKGIGASQRDEVLALFPALAEPQGIERYLAARKVVKRAEAALLRR